jgi:hypothetical protein
MAYVLQTDNMLSNAKTGAYLFVGNYSIRLVLRAAENASSSSVHNFQQNNTNNGAQNISKLNVVYYKDGSL